MPMKTALMLLVVAVGCGDDGVLADSGAADGGLLDARALDAPLADAPSEDAPPPDAPVADAPPALDAAVGRTGDRCTDDSDCSAPNTLCLETAPGSGWETFPGGYCTFLGCTFGEPCGMNGTCGPLPGHGPHCFVECTNDGDCRDGYTCQDSTFVDASLCLPPMS